MTAVIVRGIAGLVAVEHVYFLVLEMFLWSKPKGLATFKMTQEYANASAVLAANQGLYNGFLAAGMLWAMLSAQDSAKPIYLFFFACVTVAGIYGGITFSPRIAIVQATPAILGLVLTLIAF
jgi:putative membrane protein